MAGLPSPLDHLSLPLFTEKGLDVYVKRDDLIHQEIMGNKWRKLKYNLQYVKDNQLKGIVTFGGAYSNHIAATAAACRIQNIPCIGIIRGDELNPESNPTLKFASSNGMELHFVTRAQYKQMRDEDVLPAKFSDYFRLPEGGTNALAIKGCAELPDELPMTFDYLVCPIGTGGTFTGLLKGAPSQTKLLGISSLKGQFIHDEISRLAQANGIENPNYTLFDAYHFGGYAKVTDELIAFINRSKQQTGLQLEPIYTGKMFFAVWDLVRKGYFESGSKIVLVHTGGLQGIAGFREKYKKKILL